MGTGQGEVDRRVIERGIRPQHGIMALLARRREPSVIHRRFGVVVIRLMARYARRDSDAEVPIRMATRTWRR